MISAYFKGSPSKGQGQSGGGVRGGRHFHFTFSSRTLKDRAPPNYIFHIHDYQSSCSTSTVAMVPLHPQQIVTLFPALLLANEPPA